MSWKDNEESKIKFYREKVMKKWIHCKTEIYDKCHQTKAEVTKKWGDQ